MGKARNALIILVGEACGKGSPVNGEQYGRIILIRILRTYL
jgi:hypothetical protein